MKKKIFSALLVTLIWGLSACGSKDSSSNKTNATTQESSESIQDQKPVQDSEEEQTQEDTTTVESSNTPNESGNTSIQTLSDVENYLKDKGVISGEKTDTVAEMVGAIDGFKYLDNHVEVYEFDVESEAYKKLVETNEMSLIGFETAIPVNALNGRFVLYCDESTTKDDIIKVFNEMK